MTISRDRRIYNEFVKEVSEQTKPFVSNIENYVISCDQIKILAAMFAIKLHKNNISIECIECRKDEKMLLATYLYNNNMIDAEDIALTDEDTDCPE